MGRARIIPALLLKGQGLVKGVRFKRHTYVGDPINAVKIFNDKEVDELIFLDISASREGRKVPLSLVEKIADECFMPFAVGGGIRNVNDVRELISAGAEKVVINTAAIETPELITEASSIFGSQSIIVSIDVKTTWLGKKRVYSLSGRKKTSLDPVDWARKAEKLGAGELFVNSIDRDGSMSGYDLELLKALSGAVNIPVIACGGAGKIEDLSDVIHKGGVAAAAAGSFFVFHGRRRAVLINFPTKSEIEDICRGKLKPPGKEEEAP
ncbi:MAG: imidazole glycerol phosphate synthase subunit HisF [Lentisphaerae bacterium GWF2_52_8]|nr:MAG: imidazole glycerol phosphate synthase subunit HisF [Lentisphaerae bacterium GWF2_52_8]